MRTHEERMSLFKLKDRFLNFMCDSSKQDWTDKYDSLADFEASQHKIDDDALLEEFNEPHC